MNERMNYTPSFAPKIVNVNVNLRKLISAHKSHVRETSLFAGAMPNQVRNSQASRVVSVPDQNPGRSSRGNTADTDGGKNKRRGREMVSGLQPPSTEANLKNFMSTGASRRQ